MSLDENMDMSPLRGAAVQIHEMYEEFKRAGFSRKEALELTAKMMGSAFNAAQNNSEE